MNCAADDACLHSWRTGRPANGKANKISRAPSRCCVTKDVALAKRHFHGFEAFNAADRGFVRRRKPPMPLGDVDSRSCLCRLPDGLANGRSRAASTGLVVERQIVGHGCAIGGRLVRVVAHLVEHQHAGAKLAAATPSAVSRRIRLAAVYRPKE